MMNWISASRGGPMRCAVAASLIWIPLGLGVSAPASAQTTAQDATLGTELAAPAAPVVPQQVKFNGKLSTRAGDTVEAEFRIYASAEGGDPLWTETQKIAVAEDGSYTVLLGAVSPSGLPQTVFAGGVARWVGVSVERAPELERTVLASVPYAMKAGDAASLAGHAASEFVTRDQLATQLVVQPAPAFQPETGGTVTGSGTAGTVPLWTGTLTQGNSEIVQVGSDIGIHEATPGATLDVGGTATIRGATTIEGTTTLSPQDPATTSSGFASQLLDLSASAWSSTANAPLDQTFRLFSYIAGNNTATPSGTLNLQFQEGTGPVANILSINSNGTINFSPSQVFPIKGTGGGTITGITTTSPLTGSGAAGSVALGLNTGELLPAITPPLESTFNGVYAQLNANNTFTGSQGVVGSLSVTSNVAGGQAGLGTFRSPGAADASSVVVSNGTGATETFQSGCDGCFVPGTQAGDGGLRVLPANNIFLGDSTKSRLEIDSAGNELQPRTAGGAAKAMFLYSPNNGGGFEHCFNSALSGAAATTPPCGFLIIDNFMGDYVIDLGFKIDDRFFSATGGEGEFSGTVAVCTDAVGSLCNNASSLTPNRVEITNCCESNVLFNTKVHVIVF